VNSWILVAAAVAFNSSGTLLLKVAAVSPVRVHIGSTAISLWSVAAILCYGLNFLFFSKLLGRLDVSIAYPIVVGSSFVVITLGGALLFGEALSVRHAFGWAAILLGVTLLAAL
jgi:small multidrug resistance pump